MEAELNNSRPHPHLTANWSSIVGGVVFLIQGALLAVLAARLIPVFEKFNHSPANYNIVAHALLCVVLVARFIQTYLTAAVDYKPWRPGLFDVLLIFGVGALEFLIFMTITPKFDGPSFHRWLIVIAFVSIAGYLGALYRFNQSILPIHGDYIREVRLQVVNIAGLILGLIVSLIIITNRGLMPEVQMLLAGSTAAVLCFNIYYSLRTTFPEGDYISRLAEALQSTPGDPPEAKPGNAPEGKPSQISQAPLRLRKKRSDPSKKRMPLHK
ncbi:MAG: autophagy-related protein 27 [Acidobacteriota bacterium]|nr:autophagy-related protein 27 [Acidobacteriota bacterium]